jgi:CBS domain-containing membrane protein
MRFPTLLLAGASFRDRSIAALGAMLGILVTAALCFMIPLPIATWPLLVAPVGASAVLVFAVPASPLAQPWPVIGGNVISSFVGVLVAHLVPSLPWAAGIAVGSAILIMSLLRCLHPPGGAAALTAVIGGPLIAAAGYNFPLVPVAANSVVLVGAAILFHRFSGHSYPHRPIPVVGHQAPPASIIPHPEDIDRALEDLGETFDVSRDDLDLIFRQVELHAERRRSGKEAAAIGQQQHAIKPL